MKINKIKLKNDRELFGLVAAISISERQILYFLCNEKSYNKDFSEIAKVIYLWSFYDLFTIASRIDKQKKPPQNVAFFKKQPCCSS